VMLYRKIEAYLLKRKEPERLDLLRKCFYLKINEMMSRAPSRGAVTWKREVVARLIAEWQWSDAMIILLDSRRTWKVQQVIGQRKILVDELNFSYRFLSRFAKDNGFSALINSQDMSLLGRKLYAAFERKSGKIEYINRQFTQLFGYNLEDIPDLETWYNKAYPDPQYRKTVIEPWHREVAVARQNGILPPELEASVTCKDGSERRVLVRVSWVGDDKRLVNFSDMTQHWQSELRNRAHDAMLEMVAKNAPLPDILHAIVHTIETEDPTALCSVLLLDDQILEIAHQLLPHGNASFEDLTLIW
ncbi:MAG: class I adenylate cyclase, partial [Gammaproteobacteria bacterium]